MLRFILFIIITCCFANWCGAQNVKTLANGDYQEVKKNDSLITGRKLEIVFHSLDGCDYAVYETEKGKRYYLRTSKKGIVYKKYIKVEGKNDE